MFDLSASHLFLVLVIMLIIFGPSKIPEVGKNLGMALRSFKHAIDEPIVKSEGLQDVPKNEVPLNEKSSGTCQ